VLRPTRRTRPPIVSILLVGAAVSLAACGHSGGMAGHQTGGAGHGGTPAPSAGAAGAAEYDQGFIDAMVPHHQAAIEMAKVALEKAEHPELRQLAAAIVNDQDAEIAKMKGWRKAWYGSDAIPAGMGGHQMGGMDTDPQQLARAQPFDKAFIDAMIPHHQSAIDMATEAQTKATHPEIKQLAAEIIAAH
jgi:uncharacterized protein (DUF305 family)